MSFEPFINDRKEFGKILQKVDSPALDGLEQVAHLAVHLDPNLGDALVVGGSKRERARQFAQPGAFKITNYDTVRRDLDRKRELLPAAEAVGYADGAQAVGPGAADVLADQLRAGSSGLSLSSSHVGSMGGLMAVKKGLCHLAGSHLLDTADGSYNTAYIKRYLPELFAAKQVRLINLVFRDQGLIVRPGNPKRIKGIEDLAREDVTMINRQGGSGTRILLDYRLRELGIDPGQITGYGNEEFTHMSVAVAVLSGTADAGLGICAAARALKLDFVPVVTEQYDLVIPQAYFESSSVQVLLEAIGSAEFRKQVESLGGYSTQRTGELLL